MLSRVLVLILLLSSPLVAAADRAWFVREEGFSGYLARNEVRQNTDERRKLIQQLRESHREDARESRKLRREDAAGQREQRLSPDERRGLRRDIEGARRNFYRRR